MSCKHSEKKTPLPILGYPSIVDGDTIHHKIPDFSFISQDRDTITNVHLKDKIYICDFFFMSCPTICPKVMKQMLSLYNIYEGNDRVIFVSHTLDPERDTPERLKNYSENMNVDSRKWYFLTGDKEHIYEMAEAYFVVAHQDPDAPGGFNHSGNILLVDGKGHIRSQADGTQAQAVKKLRKDINSLLSE